MSIIGNIGGQSGGGSLTKSILIVTAPTGSTVTVTKGSTTKTAMEKNGEWWFKNLENGEWTIRATLGGQSATETYTITQFGVYRRAIAYRSIPEFTYTGSYEVVQDDDTPIGDVVAWKGNWKIRFLTSGELRFSNLHGAGNGIDVFLVGGGGAGGTGNDHSGGGGAGGYTATHKSEKITKDTPYSIVIGAGGKTTTGAGERGKPGGDTTAFGKTVKGGEGGNGSNGDPIIGPLATGGSNGGAYSDDIKPGTDGVPGQGTTTREFGEASGKLYAGGGRGGKYGGTLPAIDETAGGSNKDAPSNRGGGGGGASYPGGKGGTGGSGIVIIRNAREVAQ